MTLSPKNIILIGRLYGHGSRTELSKLSKHFARQPIRKICVGSNTNVCHKELMNPLIVNRSTDLKENDEQEADVPESKLSLGCCLKISAC